MKYEVEQGVDEPLLKYDVVTIHSTLPIAPHPTVQGPLLEAVTVVVALAISLFVVSVHCSFSVVEGKTTTVCVRDAVVIMVWIPAALVSDMVAGPVTVVVGSSSLFSVIVDVAKEVATEEVLSMAGLTVIVGSALGKEPASVVLISEDVLSSVGNEPASVVPVPEELLSSVVKAPASVVLVDADVSNSVTVDVLTAAATKKVSALQLIEQILFLTRRSTLVSGERTGDIRSAFILVRRCRASSHIIGKRRARA